MMSRLSQLIATSARHAYYHDAVRRIGIVAIHAAIFCFATLFSFLLRFEFNIPRAEFAHLRVAMFTGLAVNILVFHFAGLNRGWWRFVSFYDLNRLAVGNAIGSAVCYMVIAATTTGFPRSIYILNLMIAFLLTSGVRVAVRILMEAGTYIKQADGAKRAVIYGAGFGGQALLREIRLNPNLGYAVCGFVDDDVHKRGISIRGARVLGTGNELPKITGDQQIDEVLIAMPSASGAEMTAILKRCHGAGIPCKTVPGLSELMEGQSLANQIREVAVDDLLGRTPVRLEHEQIGSKLSAKTILVTGAAGSIGSELCRQIARFTPADIIGIDCAESALFYLEQEMRRNFPQVPFHAEIGSIQNRPRLTEIFDRYEPSVVFHAAAYKHVPMMESHVFEAVENNVFGTYNVALAAAAHGTSDFVMISSDKAVRPTNVMGATKRAAELLIRSLQNGGTKFTSVRFGNVLGSNGSVIPIFKQQIAGGGPVTVTHPEMRRFFMTIPEACQLVLQSAVVAKAGQICVLDMGEPVKIVDLATNLILLSGLKPNEDIKIEFTGIRPGEKLYEELSSLVEDTVPSSHEKIRIFLGAEVTEQEVERWLRVLNEACRKRDLGNLVIALKDAVTDYSPSTHLLRRVIPTAHKEGVLTDALSLSISGTAA
jgi:FlaA1/EpsC-like NDP-sugar epimerase